MTDKNALIDKVSLILTQYEALHRVTSERANAEDFLLLLDSINKDFRLLLDFEAT